MQLNAASEVTTESVCQEIDMLSTEFVLRSSPVHQQAPSSYDKNNETKIYKDNLCLSLLILQLNLKNISVRELVNTCDSPPG